LVVHGFPPELRGGTEATVEALAHGLVDAGADVVVLTGSDSPATSSEFDGDLPPPEVESGMRIYRFRRPDLHYMHWTKANSPLAGRVFEAIIEKERPDVVHVHHWLRLTRDLVTRAARLGVPAVVTLHDLSASCLIYFRIRPEDGSFCERPLAPDPCLSCVSRFFLTTNWITTEHQTRRLESLRNDSRRELSLARVVTALCSDQARLLGSILELERPVRTVLPASDSRITPAEPPNFEPGGEQPLAVGCWATMHPLKGANILIEAVRQLGDARVPITLDLAGDEGDGAWARLAPDLRDRVAGAFSRPF
jgi:glycosyltransferase involved in cell wall biosynthesis